MPRLEAEVARLYPGRGVPVYDLADAGKRVTNGTGLERSGLLLFAAAVAVAGLLVLGQALSRSVQSGSGEVPTLVALGFSRRQAAWALALPHLLSVVVAVVVTVATAVVLSPRFPIGLGRRVEPDVGLHVDLPVVFGGAALVAAALTVGVGLTAWLAAVPGQETLGATRRSTIVSTLVRLGAPPPVSIGAGLALEPGRGQRALPTRPAVVGACAGALGLIGAMTLAAGIDDATRHARAVRLGVGRRGLVLRGRAGRGLPRHHRQIGSRSRGERRGQRRPFHTSGGRPGYALLQPRGREGVDRLRGARRSPTRASR